MNSTRWYILAVAALIAYIYVSIHQGRYFIYTEGIVTDSWTGISYKSKLIDFDGTETEWPMDLWEMNEPLPEIQPVVPLPTDGLGVPESQIPERSQTSEIRSKLPGEF